MEEIPRDFAGKKRQTQRIALAARESSSSSNMHRATLLGTPSKVGPYLPWRRHTLKRSVICPIFRSTLVLKLDTWGNRSQNRTISCKLSTFRLPSLRVGSFCAPSSMRTRRVTGSVGYCVRKGAKFRVNRLNDCARGPWRCRGVCDVARRLPNRTLSCACRSWTPPMLARYRLCAGDVAWLSRRLRMATASSRR
jgi:hypothetical protein